MSRIVAFDYLRGVAIICVVAMHSTLEYVFRPAQILIDSFLHNLFIVGVPLFFFMSGFFLMYGRATRFGPFIKKKMIKVYLPAVLWTIFFGLAFSLLGQSRGIDLTTLILDIVFLKEPGHYYFVFVLMIFYVGGYFVIDLDVAKLKWVFWASLVVNLLTILVFEIIIWIASPEVLSGALMYRMPFAWIFFFVYGLYVARTDQTINGKWFAFLKANKKVFFVVMVGLWIITSLETWYLYEKLAPGGQDYFKVASFFFEVFALSYLVIAFKDFKGYGVFGYTLKLLAKYSFFIYLIHIPLVPKLLGTNTLIALSQYHFLKIIILVFLSLVIPLLLGVSLQFLERLLKTNRKLTPYIGLPD